MKWLWRVGWVVAIAVGIWQVWQRVFVTDEKRIRRVIAAMEQAVERNQIIALADHIAVDYADEHGLDRSAVLGAVRMTRSQFTALFIHVADNVTVIAPDGQTATATLVVKVLTRRAGGGETELNAERVRLHFRRTAAGWKLTKAETPRLRFD